VEVQRQMKNGSSRISTVDYSWSCTVHECTTLILKGDTASGIPHRATAGGKGRERGWRG
jgi:hypothetical protein